MNRFKKWLIPVAIVCLLLATLVGCSNAPASLGETFDPSGNPFAHRFSDMKDIRTATYVVAASDSEHRYEADYRCDGTADDVQINAALNALPATGGRVVLLDGTFTIVDPITFPKNKVTLEGQGRSTFIDGDGLATAEHGISMTDRDDCVIRNLAIQTEDGGGRISACIFIEDGSDNFLIEKVTIINSDWNAIRIEGTTIYTGCILDCRIEGADQGGVTVLMDADNFMFDLSILSCYIADGYSYGLDLARLLGAVIANNVIKGWEVENVVISTSDYTLIEGNLIINSMWGSGIYIWSANKSNIVGNVIKNNGLQGIYLDTGDYNVIDSNLVQGNQQWGILLSTVNHSIVVGNAVSENSQEYDLDYSNILLTDSDYNTISDNVVRRGGLANTPAYGIDIYDADCDLNRIIDNDLYDSGTTGKVNDDGTGTIGLSVVVPFSDGTDPQDSGYLIDADTELARAFLFLPADGEVQQVRFLKIYARGLTTETDGMRLEINVNGGADNQVYTTHATAAPNSPSTSTNIAADDVIYWTLNSAQILALSAGDSIEVKVLHEAAGGADVETNAYFRTVEIGYF